MPKGFPVCFAADGAGLRLRAGGVRPTVTERFAVRLSAAGAGRRRFTVRIDPFMTERAALRGTASAADAGFCACRFAEVMPKGRAVSFAAFGARGGSGACGGRKIMFCAASAHNNSEHKGEEDRGRFFRIIPLSINFGIYMKKSIVVLTTIVKIKITL